jgi:RNA polymerase sigma factor (sigma-70 family)
MNVSFRRSEKDILASIREGDSKVMEKLYSTFRDEFVNWSRGKFNITEDEAADHYQESITLFFEKVLNGSIERIESSIKTYLFGIGKNRVRQQFDVSSRLERHGEGLSEHYRFLAEDEDASAIYEVAKQQSESIFKSLGEGCKEILRLFYYEKKSMSEIATLLGHKNEGVSRTTKKRCLEKAKTQMKITSTDG